MTTSIQMEFSPVSTSLRRASYSVRQIVPAPVWTFGIGILFIVSIPINLYSSGVLKQVADVTGIVTGLIFSFVVIFQLATDRGSDVLNMVEANKALMNQGVANPDRHLRSHPELIKAHEALAQELGVAMSSTRACTEEVKSIHAAAMLVLSGRVAPEDSHMIVTAVRRGIIEPDEVLATVKEMKNHGALASGVL